MITKIKIKRGQIWADKKTGDRMTIIKKHHDNKWNCVFERSRDNHKMNEFVIRKYYVFCEDFVRVKI